MANSLKFRSSTSSEFWILFRGCGARSCTGTNEVSGTSEFLPLEPPVPVTGAGKSSLVRNRTKLSRLHIFKGRDLGDGLK